MKLKYTLITGLFLLNYSLSAQISTTGIDADYVGFRYGANGDSTFIFAFYSANTKPKTLKAHGFGDSTANFKWYRFDSYGMTVAQIPFKTDINEKESTTPPNMAEGGYMLVIENAARIDTFRAWVFNDIFRIDSVSSVQNCIAMQLTVHLYVERTNFSSYDYVDFCDLNNVVPTFIANNFTVDWDSEKDIYAGTGWKRRNGSLETEISPTPYIETPYSVKITNVFGQKIEYKTAPIPAMGVHAEYEVLVPDKYEAFRPAASLKGEALWRMKLNNKSVNADRFEWTGLNNQKINFLKNDTLWKYDVESVPDEIVYKTGEYPVILTSINTKTTCRNTVKQTITVADSKFPPQSLPNAFTPNGDGNNDIFTFTAGNKPESMRTLDIKIVNRNGLLIYKYKGELSKWEGWNGKMNGNGSDCSTGVYYYIVSGEGWDDKDYSGKQYTGTVHLFR
ncbi:MAG: gliding motility-associated C-terminal domain-containing protein [Prevotellaceae bacterium]|jgi:gliding motility-associated-like protein|nr:gliding motility-associated C-terminal domain-containing protein [Prevotellaceae bacterium]